jgi:hypothetical protein
VNYRHFWQREYKQLPQLLFLLTGLLVARVNNVNIDLDYQMVKTVQKKLLGFGDATA